MCVRNRVEASSDNWAGERAGVHLGGWGCTLTERYEKLHKGGGERGGENRFRRLDQINI